jgi:hypothetical protein
MLWNFPKPFVHLNSMVEELVGVVEAVSHPVKEIRRIWER